MIVEYKYTIKIEDGFYHVLQNEKLITTCYNSDDADKIILALRYYQASLIEADERVRLYNQIPE